MDLLDKELERQGLRFARYADALAEHAALCQAAGLLDLSFRSRLCLGGADRIRFLNGQVTNNVKDLAAGEGCYAALVTAKGRLESDLNIYRLPNELLLDFESGMGPTVAEMTPRQRALAIRASTAVLRDPSLYQLSQKGSR